MFNTNHSLPISDPSESEVNEQLKTLRGHLLRYCVLLSGSRHDAEDVVQAAFLKALPFLKGVKRHPNVYALLRRIAKNTWLDHLRKQGKSQPYNPEELAALCGSVSLEEPLEVESALKALLYCLTPQQRAVYLLCEVFEYTDREAGELLGISRGAVKATLHRAKLRLDSELLNKELPTDEDAGQKEVLQTYVAAFFAADIAALIRLCQSGAVDPVYAASKVITFAQTQTNARKATGGTQTSMLAA